MVPKLPAPRRRSTTRRRPFPRPATQGRRRDLGQELQPAAARPEAAGDGSGQGAGRHGRARGWRQVPAQHDHDRRRPHRHRASPAAGARLRRRQAALVADRGRLHADFRGGLRRPLGRELLVRPHQRLGERAPDALHAARSSSRGPSSLQGARQHYNHIYVAASPRAASTRGRRPDRRPRPARRAGRPLGDVDDGTGRLHALGGPARRHHRRRPLLGLDGDSARSRPASSPIWRHRRQPARGPASVRASDAYDDQRAPLRHGDDEPDRAGQRRARASSSSRRAATPSIRHPALARRVPSSGTAGTTRRGAKCRSG